MAAWLAVLAVPLTVRAQESHAHDERPVPAAAPPHGADMDMGDMKMDGPMDAAPTWQLMQDGVLVAGVNHQGSPRGGTGVIAPNWWMGMAARTTAHGRFTFTGMFSLDAATVGTQGYREIFQVGEAFEGRPLTDRQHPHDFFMQLAAVWRVPLSGATALTIAGGPVGEPALGPVAFMHRASTTDNPTAPLGHHTIDSTHVSFGVVTAAIDHGPWSIEASVFNGREPDEHRWDFDFGRLDSVSARLWFRPSPAWEVQVSTGHLTDPEALEPGDIARTTASAAWTRTKGTDFSAFTVGLGRNDTPHGARHALVAEGATRLGKNTLYARFEALQVETALLQTDIIPEGADASHADPVVAFTLGGVRALPRFFAGEPGLGADVTVYRAPDALASIYGAYPLSFHVFVRLRAPAGPMGRMWNMRMTRPMGDHAQH